MIYCNERYALPQLECFVTFLRQIKKIGGASGSIFKPLIAHTVLFLPTSTLELDFGYPLSTRYGMLYYKERHALLLECIITFLRCIKGGQLELLLASSSSLWLTPIHFCWCRLSNCIQNARFVAPSRPGECDAVLGGESHIAARVCHNLP